MSLGWRWWSAPLLALPLLVGLAPSTTMHAHEVRPALLNIVERSPGWFDVTFKVPIKGGRALAIRPVLPDGFARLGPPEIREMPGARVERSTYKSDGRPLAGARISIDGLNALQTDVMLRVELLQGGSHQAILRPSAASFQIPARESRVEIAGSYWRMGLFHILEGVDHLLFLLALFVIVAGFWRLVKTVTAFTIAHSITLALAALGVVHVPPAPTEAVIALSILFLAVEIVGRQSGRTGLTERHPWSIAFIFGLFHGLGFAGALTKTGLPEHEVPLALLMFNVGVETGQILFLAAVALLLAGLRRMPVARLQGSWRLVPYTVGSLAAFWTIERVISVFQGPA